MDALLSRGRDAETKLKYLVMPCTTSASTQIHNPAFSIPTRSLPAFPNPGPTNTFAITHKSSAFPFSKRSKQKHKTINKVGHEFNLSNVVRYLLNAFGSASWSSFCAHFNLPHNFNLESWMQIPANYKHFDKWPRDFIRVVYSLPTSVRSTSETAPQRCP